MPQMPFNPFSVSSKLFPSATVATLALVPWSMPSGGTMRVLVRGAFDVWLGWGATLASASANAQAFANLINSSNPPTQANALLFMAGTVEGVTLPNDAAWIALYAPDGTTEVHMCQGQFG